MNTLGQAVGWAYTAEGKVHAFLWDRGVITDLGTLGGTESRASGINEYGQVVGWAETTSGDMHAFLWEKGMMEDLGTLGGTKSEALSITDLSQVVGRSETATGEVHAFIWENGEMIDLNAPDSLFGASHGMDALREEAGTLNSSMTLPGSLPVSPEGVEEIGEDPKGTSTSQEQLGETMAQLNGTDLDVLLVRRQPFDEKGDTNPSIPPETGIPPGSMLSERFLSYWSLTGNAGTDQYTNFVGTTDGEPLIIQSSGGVGIGTYDPEAQLEVCSSTGSSIIGKAETTATNAFGIHGQSDSSNGGHGVFGRATATTGTAVGVGGQSDSTSGTGVSGIASAATGTTYGVYGGSDSTSGRGVYGLANATLGNTYGVYGRSDSIYGRGVYGYASATPGSSITFGVYGVNDSTMGSGAYGTSPNIGTYGNASSTTGFNVGVYGATSSPSGYGMYYNGGIGGSGKSSFTEPHPTDPDRQISFVHLGGNEAGTYFRGSSRLHNGRTVIDVPEEFRLITDPEGITVQITPMGRASIWVEEKGLDQIVIRGDRDVALDYFVNGVRRGYKNHKPVQENHAYVPVYRERPYGTQYPEAVRRILVENGTLNPDFTPNEQTAARMGWTLRDYKEEAKEESLPAVKREHEVNRLP